MLYSQVPTSGYSAACCINSEASTASTGICCLALQHPHAASHDNQQVHLCLLARDNVASRDEVTLPVMRGQGPVSNARRAAATARSTSSDCAAATSASLFPSYGFSVCSVELDLASTKLLLMNSCVA